MITYPHKVRAPGGLNLYTCVTNEAGQFFDFDDDTFKALGDCTTPFVAMTEQANGGGDGNSHYYVALDVSLLPKSLNTKPYWAESYIRAGGSPAPLTDRTVNDPTAFYVQAGQLGDFPLGLEFAPAFTTLSGTTVRGILSVTRDGVAVAVDDLDAAATIVVTAREHGAGIDLFETDPATVTGGGYFEFEQDDPGYVTDRAYQHTAVIEVNGESTTFQIPIPVFG